MVPLAKKVVTEMSACMFVLVYGPKAIAKATQPILFKFGQNHCTLARIDACKVVLKVLKTNQHKNRYWLLLFFLGKKSTFLKVVLFIFEKPGCGPHLRAKFHNRGANYYTTTTNIAYRTTCGNRYSG